MSSPSLVIDQAPPASAPASSRRLIQALIVLGLVAVALPAFLVEVPPLLDLPNHYARIWLLAGGVKLPALAHMYAIDWTAAWTNIGVDLAAQILGAVIPGHLLGPIFLALALVLPPAGAVALHRRLYGGWRWWQVGLPLAAFATTLLAGFLNYQIGIGLALLFASADPWMERRLSAPQLLMARVAMAFGLLIVHLFALGFYACLLGGLALGPRLTDLMKTRVLQTTGLRIVAVAAVVLLPLAAYLLTASHVPEGQVNIWGPTTFRYKTDVLLCAFATYDTVKDCLFFGVPLVLVAAAAACGRLRAHQGLLMVSLGLAAIALCLPTWAAQTGWIDTRVPIMAFLVLLSALNPDMIDAKRTRLAMATLLFGLVVGRAAWIGGIWIDRQSDTASIQRALGRVPAGAAVLNLDHRPNRYGMARAPVGRYFHMGASFYHAYTLSVMERQAFSPLIFTMAGKQPLRVRRPWNEIAVPNGGRSPTMYALQNQTRSWLSVAPYIRHWRDRFDYALMLNCDVAPDVNKDVTPEGMTLVADEGFARLYRIERLKPDEEEMKALPEAVARTIPAKAVKAKPRDAART